MIDRGGDTNIDFPTFDRPWSHEEIPVLKSVAVFSGNQNLRVNLPKFLNLSEIQKKKQICATPILWGFSDFPANVSLPEGKLKKSSQPCGSPQHRGTQSSVAILEAGSAVHSDPVELYSPLEKESTQNINLYVPCKFSRVFSMLFVADLYWIRLNFQEKTLVSKEKQPPK